MARPERPIDAADGPAQRFAADLRKLRVEAGSPPYREMAKQVHTSKASLSAAAGGRRLPTWEVTKQYVRACHGPIDVWHQRWLATRAEVPVPPSVTSAAPTRPRFRRRRALVPAVAVAALAAALVTWNIARSPTASGQTGQRLPAMQPDTMTSRAPVGSPAQFPDSGTEPVRDDADPEKSGCADDPATVQELSRVQINTLNHNLLGVAVLRHSAKCHASWGRFEPSARLTYLRGPVRVAITAHRPATGTLGTTYSTPFDGQAAFGNILLDTAGCVEVTVKIQAPDGDGESTTACVRGA